jgi:hypothetical protein
VAACVAALAAVALLAAGAAVAMAFARGSATLAPPLLSSRPCVIVLAAAVAAPGFLGFRAAGRMRAAWPVALSRAGSQAMRSRA